MGHSDGSTETKKKQRPRLHASMLETGLDLCRLLKDLNVTGGDAKLEEVRQMLESSLERVDIDSLRKVPEVRNATRTAMQNILDKFSL